MSRTDGSPVLFLHAEWDDDVTGNLEMAIVQNGKIFHAIDWKKQREWWKFVINKYSLQFNHQARLEKGPQFYGEASARLAS